MIKKKMTNENRTKNLAFIFLFTQSHSFNFIITDELKFWLFVLKLNYFKNSTSFSNSNYPNIYYKSIISYIIKKIYEA